MKPFLHFAAVALFLTGCSSVLRADANWLENGNFSSGADHWRGDGRSPEQYAADNNQSPLDTPDPFVSKGLILPLRGADWDKVQQDFRGRGTHGILTITYMISTDVAFSTQTDDYRNVPGQLHYDGWMPFAVPTGTWVVFVADFGSAHGTYWHLTPKLGTSQPQTVSMRVDGLTPLEDKTITIGFPPGTGKVVLLNVTFTDKGAAGSNNASAH